MNMKMSMIRQKGRKFFRQNAIVPVERMTSYSSHNLRQNAGTPSVSSLSNSRMMRSSSVKLNPNKFLHREVFNSSLYQSKNNSKMFSFSLSDRKKAQEGQKQKQLEKGLQFIKSKLKGSEFQHDERVQTSLEGLQHSLLTLGKYVAENEPIQTVYKSVIKNIEQMLTLLSNQIKKLQNVCRSQQMSISLHKIEQDKLKVQPFVQPLKIKAEIQEKWKIKFNTLDFQYKKQILMYQKLKQQMKISQESILKLVQENKIMLQQKSQIQKWRQQYQYKIRKLKQQLQVAHIVKDQNLEQKVKYILGWKI